LELGAAWGETDLDDRPGRIVARSSAREVQALIVSSHHLERWRAAV